MNDETAPICPADPLAAPAPDQPVPTTSVDEAPAAPAAPATPTSTPSTPTSTPTRSRAAWRERAAGLRARSFGLRSVLAVALASLLLGGAGGALVHAAVVGDRPDRAPVGFDRGRDDGREGHPGGPRGRDLLGVMPEQQAPADPRQPRTTTRPTTGLTTPPTPPPRARPESARPSAREHVLDGERGEHRGRGSGWTGPNTEAAELPAA